MTPIIVANWKMNPKTFKQAELLFANLAKQFFLASKADIVICPPMIFLPVLKSKAPQLKNFFWGAQNCHWERFGAYTGEISADLLKNAGCRYVIIGHSERREYLKETDEMINWKIQAAFKAGLRSILCVGEKEGEEMALTVEKQIRSGLKNVSSDAAKNLLIAYEPVWAIGSGQPCSPDDAMGAALFIKRVLTNLYDRRLAEEIKIIYGGSVDVQNAAAYFIEAKMDGLLVGGVSLMAKEFGRILKSIQQLYP